jgi:hypothetical protein
MYELLLFYVTEQPLLIYSFFVGLESDYYIYYSWDYCGTILGAQKNNPTNNQPLIIFIGT